MKHFKKTMAVVVIGGFLAGGAVGWAGIPGITEPFNPPAYYSPTTPDPEDSPSTFFYRDLVSQGQQVYDPIREKHKKDKVQNWQSILDIFLEKLHLNTINARMPNSGTLKEILASAFGINDSVDSKNKVVPMMNAVTEGTTIRATERYDDDERTYSLADKYRLNQKAVIDATDLTKTVLQSQSESQAHQEKLLQDLAKAEGTNEFCQIGNYLRYQNAENSYRRLELSSNRLALMVQEILSDVDDDITEARVKMTFRSVDPTNMDDYQKEHYAPRKPLGFPKFE